MSHTVSPDSGLLSLAQKSPFPVLGYVGFDNNDNLAPDGLGPRAVGLPNFSTRGGLWVDAGAGYTAYKANGLMTVVAAHPIYPKQGSIDVLVEDLAPPPSPYWDVPIWTPPPPPPPPPPPVVAVPPTPPAERTVKMIGSPTGGNVGCRTCSTKPATTSGVSTVNTNGSGNNDLGQAQPLGSIGPLTLPQVGAAKLCLPCLCFWLMVTYLAISARKGKRG